MGLILNNRVYLSLGSNLGDRSGNLKQARKWIEQSVESGTEVSGIYESAAFGFISSYTFYNCCLFFSAGSSPDPLVLMGKLLEIERKMGRERKGGGYSDRLIDIDLLLIGDRVLDLPGLKVPHPRMEERRFVLEPLAEIASTVIHPVHGVSIGALLESCPDPSEIRMVIPAPW